MTKRSFFKSIMGAVAAVAIAPEIAFGVKLKLHEIPERPIIGYLIMEWNNGDRLGNSKGVLAMEGADTERLLLEEKRRYAGIAGEPAKWSIQIIG